MSKSNWIIGTGYHERSPASRDFATIWYNNLREHTPFPKRIAVVSTGPRFPISADEIDTFRGENIGHVEGVEHQPNMGGWSGSVIALCLLAYNSNSDLIFREQDCLCFGPWVETMYKELGDAEMIFGKRMETQPWMPCAQGLFLIRHRFLLTFVKRFLALGNPIGLLPEHKFVALEQQDPSKFRRLSFGVDRERPLPLGAPMWYCQQLSADELTILKSANLICSTS